MGEQREEIGTIPDSTLSYLDSVEELEKKLLLLQQENKQLKSLKEMKSEVNKLEFEVKRSSSLKEHLEAKYKQVAVKLMGVQSDLQDGIEGKGLLKELEDLKEMQIKLRWEVKRKEEILQELRQRKTDSGEGQIVITEEYFQTEKVMQNITPKPVAKNKKKIRYGQSHSPTKVIQVQYSKRNIRKTATELQILRMSQTPSQHQVGVSARKYSPAKIQTKGMYFPSFMRNKKIIKKDRIAAVHIKSASEG